MRILCSPLGFLSRNFMHLRVRHGPCSWDLGMTVRSLVPVAPTALAGRCRPLADAALVTAIGGLVRAAYRLRGHDLHHVPRHGGALLVCNHVSFIDALVVTAALGRPIRFVMDHRLYHAPVLHPLMRACGVIPIASRRDDPTLLHRAYDRIADHLRAGDLVGIFPEGQITRHGDLNPFRRGVESIVERTPVPVVPMALRGLWGSFFSRRFGPAMRGLPRRFRARVDVVAGAAIAPSEVTAADLQARVAQLRGAVA